MSNSPIRSGSLGRCPRDSVPYANHLAANPGECGRGRPGVSGVAASCVTSDGTGSAEGATAAGFSSGDAAVGFSSGDAAVGGLSDYAAATAEGTPFWVGVASADAVVSLLDGEVPVCASPELCTTPERGSAVEASLGEEVELAWTSTELCTTPEHGSAVEAPRGEGVELAWASTDSEQFQRSNLTRSPPLRPTNLLTKSDPLLTYLPRILMTNSTSTTTNQTTDSKSWYRSVRRTPPPGCSPRRLRRRAQTLEHREENALRLHRHSA